MISWILDQFPQGTTDSQWLRRLAGQGYTIISGDRSRRYGGDKLEQVCEQFGITHVPISGTLHNKSQ